MKSAALAALAGLALVAAAGGAPAAQAAEESPIGPELEHGEFILHKFAQANGRETFATRAAGESRVTTVEFAFTDRGRKVALDASLRLSLIHI